MNSGKRIASRPAYSVLNLYETKEVGFYIRDWKEALRDYLSKA